MKAKHFVSTDLKLQIDGDKSSYQTQPNYYRYHLVIPSVPLRGLLIQDMVGGDNNRTPVVIRAPDIYRIVVINVWTGPVSCSILIKRKYLSLSPPK